MDALLPRVRQGVLAAVLLQSHRRWFVSELSRHLEVSPGTLHRELQRLIRAGILVRRKEGKQVYYEANPECPFLGELNGLLAKTAGVIDLVREALLPLAKRIEVAFVYGSVARGEEIATSDLDLMVVGPIGLKDLSPALERLREHLFRPVNATVFPPAEFARKVRAKDHFLRSVLDAPKLFVLGSARGLEEVARGTPR